MYKPAHRYFAAGFSGVLALVFGFTLASIILMIIIGALLGPLPDADQKFKFLTHRGGSHKFRFAVIVALPLTVLVIYICMIFNGLLHGEVFSSPAVTINGLWIPSGFYYFITGDMPSFLTDPLLLTFFVLFFAIVSHILLDVITPSGLDIFGRKMSGGILSNDPATNKLFEVFGILMIVVSIAVAVLGFFSNTAGYSIMLLVLLLTLVIGVMLYSLYKKKGKRLDQIQCYQVGNEKFCTEKKCVTVMGRKICVDD